MYRKFVATACGLTMLSASAFAQTACDAGKLSKIVDDYANAPFSATTWRGLIGLGDPFQASGREATGPGVYDWDSQDAWKKLAVQILPAGQAPQEIGYDCRISYPLEVLQARVATLGSQSKYVKAWFAGQEQVLKACSSPTTVVALPPPLEIHPALAQMQKDDRIYQEASIAFYQDKPKAIELFRAIAASSSPHKAASRYNIANLLANAKNIVEARKEAAAILADPALASVHTITQSLLGYIANMEDTPAGWTSLIDDTVGILSAPKADILASPKKQDDYSRALSDIEYVGIRAKHDDWWLNAVLPADATVSKSIFDATRKYPMALWMISGQTLQENFDGAPWSLVGDKWQQRTTTYLDQVIAVTPSGSQMPALPLDVLNTLRAKPDDATREAMWAKVHTSLDAAQKTCGDAPETAALGTYVDQAVRLSAQTGHFDQAYDELSKLPFKSTGFYLNGVLSKLAQYELGQGMAEEGRHLRDKLLTPEFFAGIPENMKSGVTNNFSSYMAWVAEDETHWKQALAMSEGKTSNTLLNFLPIKTLWAYAEDPMFSDIQKALLARVAWTREYAMGGTPSADETTKLYATNPTFKSTADDVAKEYPTATPERQRLLTILRYPRMGILVNSPDVWTPLEEVGTDWTDVSSGDHNDRNWWCPLETDRELGSLRSELNNSAGMISAEDYGFNSLKAVFDQKLRDNQAIKMDDLLKQHPMVKSIDWKQVKVLANMPSAPQLLAQSAVRWGKASKGDDGAPEALAQAVRVTHYGCNWHGRVGAYSKPAQELLKAKFASTTWATQTPYWFDCQRMQWDKDYNKKAVCDAKTWPKQAPLK